MDQVEVLMAGKSHKGRIAAEKVPRESQKRLSVWMPMTSTAILTCRSIYVTGPKKNQAKVLLKPEDIMVVRVEQRPQQ